MMSASLASRRVPSYQPYQCVVCQSRFTRHENLKRHAMLHSRSQEEASLPCGFCQATFSRPDLRHRHMKRKHPEHEQRRAAKRSQRHPPAPRQGSDGRRPQRDKVYVYTVSSPESQDGLAPGHSGDDGELEMDSGMWHTALQYTQQPLDQDRPTESINIPGGAPASPEGDRNRAMISQQMQLPSMNDSNCVDQIVQNPMDLARSLLQGTPFLKTSYHSYHPDTQLHQINLSQCAPLDASLAESSFNQGIPERLLSSDSPQLQDDWSPSPLQITRGCELFFLHVSHFAPILHKQTFDSTHLPPHLVLSILCLAYQYGEDPECGDQAGSGASLSIRCFNQARALTASEDGRAEDLAENITIVQSYLLLQIYATMYLCGSDSAYGLKIHSNMISLARASGLMQPMPTEPFATQDLDSLWREFIKAESHKRTSFAVHQIDALWYQLLSIPRCISHLEVKHDLPCPEDQWIASSSAEWAHRQLVAKHSGPSVPYTDAVRRFLSPESDLNSIPPFDPYGAINITQFLISSAREVSGWSAMTGLISMDRLDALRSSLVSLSPFIRPQPETTKRTHGASSCAATWETAMIELHLWSPSHTGGIVAASMDTVLNHATSLAPTYEFLCEANTAKAVQPHVDWFLRYLDTILVPDAEAPWTAVYAYKAFLIAWQQVRGRLPGAMQVVGIEDGDLEGALMWARKVFQRRDRWQLGKLIMACLDELGS
ncbi:fungal-specific transcription factor domain-containing protein [Aspergillus leporis]|uniref:Fungal-specific transcription factor domain-containing protein n=1 Tax=Aspergillus leporis TaxID=41062 RepID=A0A5N5X2H6_9EURO|nr:fungal-specific transcription factor domain-containing protein [Aspergillus leporis]